jgi:PKD repeat protein
MPWYFRPRTLDRVIDPDATTGTPSMLDTLRRRWRTQSRGQSLTEFALILPVLILSLLIVLDFGRLFFSYVTLTNATRVAANFGSLDPASFTGTPNTTTYDAVVLRETAGLNCNLQDDAAGHNPPIPTFPTGTSLGSMSVVSMTCDFTLITPIISNFFGGTLPISASAEFPVRTGAISNIGGTTTLPPPGSPVADFTFTDVSGGTINGSGNVTGTAPVTVNVVDASSNAQTWEWDWGDGTTHEFVPNPAPHQYNGANTYNVTLTVRNTVGSSSRSRTVTVGSVVVPPPVAGFYGTPVPGGAKFVAGGGSSGTPISGSLALVVDFSNNSTNGTAFSWDFGDGSAPSTQAAPQHQYSALGIYSVTLTVTAPTGGTPLTRSAYVTAGCLVPNFANTSTANADASWSGANFTGEVLFHKIGDNANKTSKSPPSPAANITIQSTPGGTFIAPTKQGGQPYRCDDDITVDYTP